MSVLELHELTSRSGLGLNFFSVACAVKYKYGSVQFNHSAMSDYLQPHGLQHTRTHCPSPTPGVYSDSCPLSQWCHPTISSSVIPNSSHLQSFQHQGLFKWVSSSHESIGVSASASVLAMNIQDWSPFGWTGWISLMSKGCSRVFSNTTLWPISASPITLIRRLQTSKVMV